MTVAGACAPARGASRGARVAPGSAVAGARRCKRYDPGMDIPPRDPALDDLDIFVGGWETEATHPLIDGIVRGRCSYEWLTGRSFLIQRSEMPPNTVPSSIWVVGGASDTAGVWPVHYFDSRGVTRVYQLSFRDRVLKIWRDQPGFMQRSVGVFEDDRTFRLRSQLAEGTGSWKRDLEMTLRRR